MLPKRLSYSIKVIIILMLIFDPTLGKQKCGTIVSNVRGGKLQGKIVGGYDVGYYKYPWFASLQIDDDPICGGAIIGPSYVLTAAHCFDNYIEHHQSLEKAYMIKVGLYNNCKKEPTQKVFKVSKVTVHEKYAKAKPYFDIALLKLSGETTGYEPICLPPKVLRDTDQEGEGWIIGHGSMIEDGGDDAYPCELREARLLVYDNMTCRNMLEKLTDIKRETAFIRALCAGYKSGGIDTCQGDSGGPLMTVDSLTKRWQTIGVTSFGYGCGDKNAMGIYTDVSRYLDWIEEHSGIKPSQFDDEVVDETPHQDIPAQSNTIADAFNAIYDHIMNSPHGPQEIVIRFKAKNALRNSTVKNHKVRKHKKLKQKPHITLY